MTPYLEYNFEGTQDAITLAHIESMATALSSNNGVDPQFIMDCASGWISTKGAYIYQGHRMHGDSAPDWWVNDPPTHALDQRGTDPSVTAVTLPEGPAALWYNPILVNYWNALNAWGVVWVHEDNTTTNAFTSMYDVQLYVLSLSTGQWTRVDASDGRPKYPFDYYALATYALTDTGSFTFDQSTSRRGWNNCPVAGDRSASSAVTTKYRISHNALLPMVEVDGSDVGGIFVTCKARLFTSDGAAFNGVTKLYGQVGSDIKPELTSALNTGDLAGATYYVGAGGGNLVELPTDGSSMRLSFCTVGGSGFSTNIDGANDSVYGAVNPVYLSYDEISANLPVLKFNDHPTFENGYFTEYSDVSYGGDSEHLLDVYGTGGSNRKTIVMVHGGLWVAGDKANTNVVRNKVTYWCSRGYAVVSINYRMTGVALSLLPLAQVTDIETALDFLKANAATYGIDTTKIILMGHSSGGHIATLFAITRPTEIAGAVILDSAVMDMDDTMNNTHIAAFDTIFGETQVVWDANSPKYQFTDYNEPDIPLTHTMIVSSTISAQMTAQNSAFATLASATLIASGYNHEDTNANLGLYGDYTAAVANFIETLV